MTWRTKTTPTIQLHKKLTITELIGGFVQTQLVPIRCPSGTELISSKHCLPCDSNKTKKMKLNATTDGHKSHSSSWWNWQGSWWHSSYENHHEDVPSTDWSGKPNKEVIGSLIRGMIFRIHLLYYSWVVYSWRRSTVTDRVCKYHTSNAAGIRCKTCEKMATGTSWMNCCSMTTMRIGHEVKSQKSWIIYKWTTQYDTDADDNVYDCVTLHDTDANDDIHACVTPHDAHSTEHIHWAPCTVLRKSSWFHPYTCTMAQDLSLAFSYHPHGHPRAYVLFAFTFSLISFSSFRPCSCSSSSSSLTRSSWKTCTTPLKRVWTLLPSPPSPRPGEWVFVSGDSSDGQNVLDFLVLQSTDHADCVPETPRISKQFDSLPWEPTRPQDEASFCERIEAPLPQLRSRPECNFTHPRQLSPFPERLVLPFSNDDFLCGYEAIVSSWNPGTRRGKERCLRETARSRPNMLITTFLQVASTWPIMQAVWFSSIWTHSTPTSMSSPSTFLTQDEIGLIKSWKENRNGSCKVFFHVPYFVVRQWAGKSTLPCCQNISATSTPRRKASPRSSFSLFVPFWFLKKLTLKVISMVLRGGVAAETTSGQLTKHIRTVSCLRHLAHTVVRTWIHSGQLGRRLLISQTTGLPPLLESA